MRVLFKEPKEFYDELPETFMIENENISQIDRHPFLQAQCDSSSGGKVNFAGKLAALFNTDDQISLYFYDSWAFVGSGRDVPCMIQRLLRPNDPHFDIYAQSFHLIGAEQSLLHAVFACGLYFEWGLFVYGLNSRLLVRIDDELAATFWPENARMLPRIAEIFEDSIFKTAE